MSNQNNPEYSGLKKEKKEKPIIEIKNLGKKYNINRASGGYVATRDVFANIFSNLFRFSNFFKFDIFNLKKYTRFCYLGF